MNLVKLNVYDKKCVMINTNGYYDPLKELIDRMIDSDFMWGAVIDKILSSDDIDIIEKFICECVGKGSCYDRRGYR